jgi:hypothetical protein
VVGEFSPDMMPSRGSIQNVTMRRCAVATDRGRPGRGDDFDPVNDAAHALDFGRDGLGHLLEVVGGETAAEMEDAVAGVARDVPQGEIAAPSEPVLGLQVNLPAARRSGAFRFRMLDR